MSITEFASVANAPIIAEIPTKVFIGNSVMAVSNPWYSAQKTLGTIFQGEESQIVRVDEGIDPLLYCKWGKESSWGRDKYIRGDHGLAYGDFQIHIDKHDITEWCAMDFECSRNFTASKIKAGQGWLWTSYSKCLDN